MLQFDNITTHQLINVDLENMNDLNNGCLVLHNQHTRLVAYGIPC